MSPSTLLRFSRNVNFSRKVLRTQVRIQSNVRPLSTSPYRFASREDPEENKHQQRETQLDREKMNPEANEYAKSSSDDSAAKNEDAAFDPNITDPEEARKKAGEGNEVNPLDSSPANPDISSGTAEEQGGSKKKVSEGGGGR
ncbi:hypothetical protein LTR10_022172 [Elasticomyces elasticus]|uniref:Uncharacterized protein n=1 Tax=Exophiala sideris TaxID=1016849 RepID=A0ABR0IUX9_9EURO|nr:hypothetical protein LTR10_022172 [Elasticomyces elasticus]KAK5021186.1 hypothetical protein LTS07_011182 [Exophiala sideris]KAK5023787.1 hypothetical protein LTR13_011096 [Exophiala sideris]KAK5048866.1 hypothetical protein LTR69_011211 [Exophiala sideris]KAK5176344.1 hypothetical protein LTR44_011106 [Eurotiomycetes sp. CCFEE 6388]